MIPYAALLLFWGPRPVCGVCPAAVFGSGSAGWLPGASFACGGASCLVRFLLALVPVRLRFSALVRCLSAFSGVCFVLRPGLLVPVGLSGLAVLWALIRLPLPGRCLPPVPCACSCRLLCLLPPSVPLVCPGVRLVRFLPRCRSPLSFLLPVVSPAPSFPGSGFAPLLCSLPCAPFLAPLLFSSSPPPRSCPAVVGRFARSVPLFGWASCLAGRSLSSRCPLPAWFGSSGPACSRLALAFFHLPLLLFLRCAQKVFPVIP